MYLPNMMIVVGLLVLYGCLETRAYLGQDGMLNRPYTREDMIRGLQGITVVDVGDPSLNVLYDGNQFYGCPRDSNRGTWSCKRFVPASDDIIHQFDPNMGLNDETQSDAVVKPNEEASDQQTGLRLGLYQKDVDVDTPVRAMFNPTSIFNDESMGIIQSYESPSIISQSAQLGSNVQSQNFENNPSLLFNQNIANANYGGYIQQPAFNQQDLSNGYDTPLYYGSATLSKTSADEEAPTQSQNNDVLADEEVFARIGNVATTINRGYNIGTHYNPVYMQQFAQANGKGGGGGGNAQTQVYNNSPSKRRYDEVEARFGGFPSRIMNLGNTDTSDVEVTNIIANSFNKDSEKKTNIIDSFKG